MSEKPTYEALEQRVKDLEKENEKNKQIEEEFVKRQKYLESVFYHAPDAIVTLDSSHHVLEWNPGAQMIFGYSSDEARGKDLDDLVSHSDVEQEAHDNTRKVLSGQPLKPTESVRYRKDGTSVQVIASGAPIIIDNVLKGAVALYTDISDRKQTETALKKSEKQFQDLFNSITDLVYTQDMKGHFTSANPALQRLFGYNMDEFVGHRAPDFMDPELQSGFNSRYLDVVEKQGYHEGIACYFKKNKEKIYIEYKSSLVKPDGGEPYISGIGRDVTERVLSEGKVKKLQEQIAQARKMESIGTLAGGIAHDFNNILSPILGYTEMLLDDTSKDSPSRDSLNEIFSSALRAKALVKQILTFSRQDTNELNLIKMQPVIKEALNLIRSSIPATIDIKQYIQADCSAIKADPTQIHQIVMNLSTNAYHAMEETGGELIVSLKEVKLGEYDVISPDMIPGLYACLIVADTGVGMDKVLTEKIFDPFFTTKEEGKGTGMGLSVVHGIVKSMGGDIQVYTKMGKGTEFYVYFPAGKSSFEKRNIQIQEPIQKGIERILLVDDEDAIITMEKKMLERIGYQVTSRTSSIEALETFQANPDSFDMVITNMAMPNMSGDKLSVELVKIRSDIPILLCTGFGETMSEEKVPSLGIKGFLMKPIMMKDLAQKIRDVLDENIK